ncbi:hypothetical protein Q5P01_000441 [Channa striata]|uniref:Uncharacterized protein n=1 Tax=Channa striata TaxID=64152 RepID=A0AA88IXS4_CHASR|nr:hypothetical protein Q5P01_000441 [Channa striata]
MATASSFGGCSFYRLMDFDMQSGGRFTRTFVLFSTKVKVNLVVDTRSLSSSYRTSAEMPVKKRKRADPCSLTSSESPKIELSSR